ncbi:hypothetical protein X975_18693, partial [Stegodyphus mimosarum]
MFLLFINKYNSTFPMILSCISVKLEQLFYKPFHIICMTLYSS